jgi:hypothetical protein
MLFQKAALYALEAMPGLSSCSFFAPGLPVSGAEVGAESILSISS